MAKAGDAAKIFGATKTESTVTYGMHGNTRYGTITRKERKDAVAPAKYSVSDKLGERGAFGFGVTDETARARYVQTKGTARYEGQTLAVSGGDKQYAGDIEISINFTAEKVDGLITNLMTTEGESWEYLFGEVDSIVLPKADLSTQGMWALAGKADINFGRRAGSYRPQEVASTFEGRLLGGNTAPEAGSEVVGVWSVGAGVKTNTADGTEDASYLAGGFGANRVADEPVRRPSVDDGTAVSAMMRSSAKTTLANGQLTATPQALAWYYETLTLAQTRSLESGKFAGGVDALYFRKADEAGDANVKKGTAKESVEIALADLLAKEGGEYTFNSPKTWVQDARERIQKQRDKIAGLKSIGDLETEEQKAWDEVLLRLVTNVFWDVASDGGNVGGAGINRLRLGGTTSGATEEIHTELPLKIVDDGNGTAVKTIPGDVLDRIDAILEALSSAESLEAAFDPGQDGLFVIEDDTEKEDSFLKVHGGNGELFDSAGDNKLIWNTSGSAIFNQPQWQIKATAGSTDYTRFGVWRIQHARNALRAKNWYHQEVDAFTWSPLPTATAQRRDQLPAGTRATYEGKTLAYLGKMTGRVDDANIGSQDAYEGTVSVEVEWFATDYEVPASIWTSTSESARKNGVGAHVTTVLSDLRSVSSGDYLYHSAGGSVTKEVRRLTFPKKTFGTDDTWGYAVASLAGNHKLDFRAPIGSTQAVTIDYRDSAAARATVNYENNSSGYGMDFVGNSADGPLGVMGYYQLSPSGFVTYDASAAGASTIPELTLKGAFGADLP